MDNFIYEKQKKNILNSLFPYKVLEKTDILSKGNNLLEINGNEVSITTEVQRYIDRFIGVSKKQANAMLNTYGQESLTDLRNWFAMAGGWDGANRIAIIADPQEKKVTGISAIKKDVLSPETFFDFIEMFMDKNGYEPVKMQTGSNGTFGINVILKPLNSTIRSFGNNEDFLTNGIYFKWNLGELETGNYMERLVCVNGHVAAFPEKTGLINDFSMSSINKVLEIPKDNEMMNFNFEILQKRAKTAQSTVASVSEVKNANKILINLGVEKNLADVIAPYDDLKGMYESAGYMVETSKSVREERFKSDILFWDLFNRLTYFATHNQVWENDDIRRQTLMKKSFQFLNSERDIKEYVNIFA